VLKIWLSTIPLRLLIQRGDDSSDIVLTLSDDCG